VAFIQHLSMLNKYAIKYVSMLNKYAIKYVSMLASGSRGEWCVDPRGSRDVGLGTPASIQPRYQ
jgi:hypothetical protein